MVLVGYWPLDEASGDAIDYSGNGNDGSLSSPTQGQSGVLESNPYSFDGTDTVELPNGAFSFLGDGDFTWCAWVYPSNIGDSHVMLGYEDSQGVDIQIVNGLFDIREHDNDSTKRSL